MGWDYWMRVAFRRAGKECIVPEVSRSHHVAEKGSSINSNKQVELFKMMTFADVPSSCVKERPCRQFGDVSYLLEDRYEELLDKAIKSTPRVPTKDVRTARLNPKLGLYVLPYKIEDYKHLMFDLNIRPKTHQNVIPKDIRSEHYGIFLGRQASTNVPVLAVDMRSKRSHLLPSEQLLRDPAMVPVTAAPEIDCLTACQKKGMHCDVDQMHFLNDCNELRKHFACEEGCAHQVGKELPVYVTGDVEATHKQCLVTFISPMSCTGQHKSTSRLCACMPGPGAPVVQTPMAQATAR